jgi:hypothetical protein
LEQRFLKTFRAAAVTDPIDRDVLPSQLLALERAAWPAS